MNPQERAFQGSKVKYLATHGLNCLGCASILLLRSSMEFVHDEWRQRVTCTSCGATWHNIYTLSGTKITYTDEVHHKEDP